MLGLPAVGAGVVFANFNKNEKLEPVTFNAWMAILRRTPGSILWLLRPVQNGASSEQMTRIHAEAAALGVHPSRILFADRCEKDMHLARHRHVDVFLDSLVVRVSFVSCFVVIAVPFSSRHSCSVHFAVRRALHRD